MLLLNFLPKKWSNFFLLRKHRNEPKKKQGKKNDRSVSRLEETSVVWKDNHFHYTHDLMTSWYIENLRLLGALMWMPSNQILWKRGTDYMKEQKYSYSQRIGKTTFIVNVKQSESAKKPLNTVFQDICKHEVLGGFFTDKSFNLENPQKVSWQTRPRGHRLPGKNPVCQVL